MSKLVLDSLEIKNFRAFKHLRIEKLGRVNLIVGKNNVGKSSVLEALWLYARRGDPSLVWNILASRDEITAKPTSATLTADDRINALRHLFHERKTFEENPQFIQVGPIGPADGTLSDITLFVGVAVPIAPSAQSNGRTPPNVDFDELEQLLDTDFSLVAGFKNQVIHDYPLAYHEPRIKTYKTAHKDLNCVHASAQGLSNEQISSLWDATALTSSEEDVLLALRVIVSEVVALNLVGDEGNKGARIAKVRVGGAEGPIPLRSMGEGMSRMFGIALALVNAKDGMLLIDEVDTGLHYSVLPDLWKLIFEVAHRLNVQVFATTHSKDCLEAFQYAAEGNTEEEGVLIRLENRKAGVGAVTFDEEELSVVAREHIEVR